MSPEVMLFVGAALMFAALGLLRLLRRARRMLWAAAVLAAAGGVGTGSDWAVMDAVNGLLQTATP